MSETPAYLQINGQNVELTQQNVGVALFWEKPGGEDHDYIDYHYEDEAGVEHHHLTFNPYLARWMGGIALRAADRRDLANAERQHGSFRSKFGWSPVTIIEQRPSENEQERYIQALIGKTLDTDNNLREDLNKALKEDLES
jgi:hypothetical protein